jgi:lipoyl(octanoyl) transferase
VTEVWCVRAGTVPYERARELQGAIEQARHAGEVPDVLLLLEHPPVYTRGRRSDPGELPMGEDWYHKQGIEVCETDRGGRVTYHGPGQLVGYPIIALGDYDGGVHGYVRRLEQVMSGALEEWGVKTQVFSGLTGMWTAGAPPIPIGDIGPQGSRVGLQGQDAPEEKRTASEPVSQADAGGAPGAEPCPPSRSGPPEQRATTLDFRGPAGTLPARKIGAIGVHVRRGITTHGFAINVNNDLQPFEWIVPCGIEAAQTTSLTNELGAEQNLQAFAATLAEHYSHRFSRRLKFLEPAELAEHVAGVGSLHAETAGARAGAA